MQSKLIEVISQKVQLTAEDIELCKKYFEAVSFTKNEIIEEQDKIPEYLYFIVSGFMRLFYYDDNGDEVTTQINHSNSFTASYMRFIHGIKAKENVECITDCTLLRISKPNLSCTECAIIFEHSCFRSFDPEVGIQVMQYGNIKIIRLLLYQFKSKC